MRYKFANLSLIFKISLLVMIWKWWLMKYLLIVVSDECESVLWEKCGYMFYKLKIMLVFKKMCIKLIFFFSNFFYRLFDMVFLSSLLLLLLILCNAFWQSVLEMALFDCILFLQTVDEFIGILKFMSFTFYIAYLF